MPRKRKQSRTGHKLPHHPSRLRVSVTTIILIVIGLLFIALSVWWHFHEARILSFTTPAAPTVIEELHNALPVQLSIPDLDISLEITPTEVKNGAWEISQNGASYLVNSAIPGTPGNIVMYGHNKTKLLGNLKLAKMGQKIYVITADTLLHTYEIQQILTVSPAQIEVIQPTPEEILTLYTCTGFLDSQRLVIKARPTN